MTENSKCDCIVAFKEFGFHPVPVTEEGLKQFFKEAPNFAEQYIERFNYCPRCGRKIDWDKIKGAD